MTLDIVWTTQFKAMKCGLEIELLDDIIRLLARGEPLLEKNHDHALTGNWKGSGNVTFKVTGCLCTASRTTFLC